MQKILIVYMPVLHGGYRQLIERVVPDKIYLIGDDILQDVPDKLDYVRRKDLIRAVPTDVMQQVLACMCTGSTPVDIANDFSLKQQENLREKRLATIVMPDEDVSHYIAQKYFNGNVAFEKIFLRWDRSAVSARETVESAANMPISDDLLDRTFMRGAFDEARKSNDWWRQIGAVLVKDGTLLFTAHNTHVPHPEAPNIFGDPRSLFKRGIRIECSSAEHAEASIIAEAAKRGIATKDASLYVTTFPCPQCAILVAHAGIKRCFFASGYSVLHGESVMRDKGVELIYVDMKASHE